MSQLRRDYDKFKELNTEVLVMVPNGPKMIERYLSSQNMPYTILSDKSSQVTAQYFQVKHFFAFGTPTVFLVDTTGKIIYAHYASSLMEEPDNREPLVVLAQSEWV